MNLGSLIGMIGGWAMIIFSIVGSGGSIMTYVDMPSFLM
ncbi:MAG: motility protein A, partial [Spirochaetaceae bacterium]|nr:motility protein A [Spirochaetaceae bacterium]